MIQMVEIITAHGRWKKDQRGDAREMTGPQVARVSVRSGGRRLPAKQTAMVPRETGGNQ
jgi:hypothetical protein